LWFEVAEGEMMIQVYIFEDNPAQKTQDVITKFFENTTSIEAYGKTEDLRLSSTWNNLSTSQSKRLILNDADFIAAIQALQRAKGMSVFFFDMNLNEVVLKESHLDIEYWEKLSGESESEFVSRKQRLKQALSQLLISASKQSNISDAICRLNDWGFQGLFLLVQALVNPEIDADFYIASFNNTSSISLERLNQSSRYVGSVNSLSKATVPNDVEEDLSDVFSRYTSRRQVRLEEILWPLQSVARCRKWFRNRKVSAENPIPHDHSVFLSHYRSDDSIIESELGEYLRDMLVYGYRSQNKSDVPPCPRNSWFDNLEPSVKRSVNELITGLLKQEWVYEGMKSFWGHKTLLLDSDSQRPRVSCFLFPLLCATCPTVWKLHDFQCDGSLGKGYEVTFEESSDTASKEEDLSRLKKIFTTSHELFSQLAAQKTDPRRGEDVIKRNKFNKMSVSVDVAGDFGYFRVGVGFSPCARASENGGASPILTRTQVGVSTSDEPRSSTLGKFWHFQRACDPGLNSDRCVFSWFLPGKRKGQTELCIGVVSRPKPNRKGT
jgi:hypothetical protein